MHEVLFPNELDIRQAYDSSFVGMTDQRVDLDDLLAVRSRLMRELSAALTAD